MKTLYTCFFASGIAVLARLVFRLALTLALLAAPLAQAQAQARAQGGIDLAELVRKYEQARAQRADVPQAMVLVSFGMPADSLERLVSDASRAKVPLVLRGLVDNSFTATARSVHGVDPKAAATWLVDPRPFRRLELAAVPVFAVSEGDGWQLVRGDVSLDYALGIIVARGGQAGLEAARLVSLLAKAKAP